MLPAGSALQARIPTDILDLLHVPLPSVHRTNILPSRDPKLFPGEAHRRLLPRNVVAPIAAVRFLIHAVKRPLVFPEDFSSRERIDVLHTAGNEPVTRAWLDCVGAVDGVRIAAVVDRDDERGLGGAGGAGGASLFAAGDIPQRDQQRDHFPGRMVRDAVAHPQVRLGLGGDVGGFLQPDGHIVVRTQETLAVDVGGVAHQFGEIGKAVPELAFG